MENTSNSNASSNVNGVRGNLLLAVPLLFGLAFFSIWALAHYGYWIVNPFPNEYREGVALDIADLLTRGVNPFSSDAPASFFYMYGFLNSWLAVAIGHLLGINSYALHRIVSVSCTFLASVLVADEVRRRTNFGVVAYMAFLLMLVTSWVLIEVNARPDQLGLLLCLSALVVVERYRGRVGMIVAVLLPIAAFYTKQYFIIGALQVFVYLLFDSKKRALVYFTLTTLCLVITWVAVTTCYPYYLPMAVLSFGGTEGSIRQLLGQSAVFARFYWPLLALVGISLVRSLKKVSISLDIREVRLPLFVVTPKSRKSGDKGSGGRLLAYYVSFVVGGLVLLFLGQSKGAFLSYFYQFLLPAVVVIGMSTVESCCSGRWLWPALLLITMFGLCHGTPRLGFTAFLSASDRANWEAARRIIDARADAEMFFNVPVLVDAAIGRPRRFYDNGHSRGGDWLNATWTRARAEFPRTVDLLFPYAGEVVRRYTRYGEEVKSKIEARRFGLVVTREGEYYCFGELLLRQNYLLLATLPLKTGAQTWRCEFWVPAP